MPPNLALARTRCATERSLPASVGIPVVRSSPAAPAARSMEAPSRRRITPAGISRSSSQAPAGPSVQGAVGQRRAIFDANAQRTSREAQQQVRAAVAIDIADRLDSKGQTDL